MGTERNLTEQYPYAIQQIQKWAQVKTRSTSTTFPYSTLTGTTALPEYLDWVRSQADRHYFVVLDVISDCIGNFNQIDESMQLVDTLNKRINNYDVTFLCVIYVRPRQRG